MKKKVSFVKSAAKFEQCPDSELPEIAFIGRSNAGKSSLINAIFGTRIAKVSGTPGKTTLLNFFNVSDDYFFVDTPGYGYAARSRSQVRAWQKMMETYFTCRSNVVGAVLVMDIRRKWQEEEEQIHNWLQALNIPLLVALSKTDKLNRRDRERKMREFKALELDATLFATSTEDTKALDAVSDFLTNEWGKTRIQSLEN